MPLILPIERSKKLMFNNMYALQEWRKLLHSFHEGATVYVGICYIPKLQMEFLSSHSYTVGLPRGKTIQPIAERVKKSSELIPTQHRIANSALYLYIIGPIVHDVRVVHAVISISKDRSRAYCVRSSVHLAMASAVEARTAEEAKRLSMTESVTGSP